MSKSLIELSADIIAAQAEHRSMTQEDMAQALRTVFQTLRDLNQTYQSTEPGDPEAKSELAYLRQHPLESIQRNQVICLESGNAYKLLSNRHLALYGLTPREYKKKWGIQFVESSSTPYDLVIRWESPNEQLTEFLTRTPVIVRRDGGLAGVTALTPQAGIGRSLEEQVDDIHRSLWMAGLDQLFVMVPSGYRHALDMRVTQNREDPRSGRVCRTVLCDAEHFLTMYGGMRSRRTPSCAE